MGIGFRLTNIDHKIYWHDEAFSTFRAAGYLGQEIYDQIFQGQPITPTDLQVFQQLKPNSTYADTLKSLAVEDPQHVPLYFLVARGWMQVLGSSMTASRLLPIVISLGSLPLMYLLTVELFAAPMTAWFATALLALSPIDILFAQTARQYSLLTLSILLSSWLLLRASRLHHPRAWLWYGLSVALGLYSHAFFVLNWVAQGIFSGWQGKRTGLNFLLTSGFALMLFSPWMIVQYVNHNTALMANQWSGLQKESLVYITTWLHTFAGVVVDMPVPRLGVGAVVLWLMVLTLIGYGFVVVLRTASKRQCRFVYLTAWVPFLLLLSADLTMAGSRSTVPRYLLGTLPGIQLALAYGLTHLQRHYGRLAQVLWGIVLVASLTSCLVSARAETWWVKDNSYENAATADYLNAHVQNWVLTDRGDYTNMGNLLALSYHLKPGVIVLPFPNPVEASALNYALPSPQTSLLGYRPSPELQELLQSQGYQLEKTDVSGILSITRPAGAPKTLP